MCECVCEREKDRASKYVCVGRRRREKPQERPTKTFVAFRGRDCFVRRKGERVVLAVMPIVEEDEIWWLLLMVVYGPRYYASFYCALCYGMYKW